MSYANLQSRANQEDQLRENLANKWISQNANVSNANAALNWQTETANFLQAASPIVQKQLQDVRAQQEYDAKIKELLNPTGLSIAKGEDFDDKEEAKDQLTNLKLQNDIIDKKYPRSVAMKMDTATSRIEREVTATKFANNTVRKMGTWINEQINNSNLVFKFTNPDGTERLIDLSKGIQNPEDHALVVQHFTNEYLKATRLLDLNPKFLRSLGIDKAIGKSQATLQSDFVTFKQEQDTHVKQELARNKLETMSSKLNESMKALADGKIKKEELYNATDDLDSIFQLLRTTYKDGKRLGYNEIHQFLWNHAEAVAKSAAEGEQLNLYKLLLNSKYTVNGKLVSFSKVKLDTLRETIGKESTDNRDALEAFNRVQQDSAEGMALRGASIEDIQKEFPGVNVESIQSRLDYASKVSPESEARIMQWKADVLGRFPSPDDFVHPSNIELRDKLASDGESYHGRINNQKYKDALGDIQAVLNFDGKSINAVGKLVKLEARQMYRIAKSKLDKAILQNRNAAGGMDGAIDIASGDVIKELQKIEGIDDLRKHKWMINPSEDRSARGRETSAIRHLTDNARTIDFTKPLSLDEKHPVSLWLQNLPDDVRQEIIQHGAGHINIGAPSIIKDLRKQINKSRSSSLGTINDRTLSKWLYKSLGSPGAVTDTTNTNTTSDDKDEELMSKVRNEGSAPNLISAIDNQRRNPTLGGLLWIIQESRKIRGDYIRDHAQFPTTSTV